MSPQAVLIAVVWSAGVLFGIVLMWQRRGRTRAGGRRVRSGPGPGAMGAVYGMLQEDKRKAIEIVVEGRAAETDPEHADGTPKAGSSPGGATP